MEVRDDEQDEKDQSYRHLREHMTLPVGTQLAEASSLAVFEAQSLPASLDFRTRLPFSQKRDQICLLKMKPRALGCTARLASARPRVPRRHADREMGLGQQKIRSVRHNNRKAFNPRPSRRRIPSRTGCSPSGRLIRSQFSKEFENRRAMVSTIAEASSKNCSLIVHTKDWTARRTRTKWP